MNSQHRHTYAESGVDILVEEEAIRALTSHFIAKKKGSGSPINIKGAYAGLLDMGGFILGFTTDGVGSKVLIATEMGNWRTIGIDCMAMNVNDLYAMGLEPIAFVDYLAMETVEPSIADQIGQGLSLIHISEPTRLGMISYAVFCLKKKKKNKNKIHNT